MATEKTVSYLVRDISPVLWRRVKMTAAARGETIRVAVLRLLESYISTKRGQ